MIDRARALVAESSVYKRPVDVEREIERIHRYSRIIEAFDLSHFSSLCNPGIKFFTHHYCHARAASALSPFRTALILVMDGCGNAASAFGPEHPEIKGFPAGGDIFETCTAYLLEEGRLECVDKQWHFIENWGSPNVISEGLGWFYDLAARYIFNSRVDCGKVMGLAPFGSAERVSDQKRYFERLGWGRAFQGHGKTEWEASSSFRFYADVAASVQAHFTQAYLAIVRGLKERFPKIENLVLTGGCALNCAANMKVIESRLFSSVYVPPFPGDESIGFGAAQALRLDVLKIPWAPLSWEEQVPNFGPNRSVPSRAAAIKLFQGRKVRVLKNVPAAVAKLLREGKVVGWFQGRSESGPRALGFRSVLADPTKRGMKDYLNERIKGREKFRPYGCTVLWEKSHDYFDVPEGFESPFMSFAPRVRGGYGDLLREITHVDGTSRIQTLRRGQNPLFYALIEEFGRMSGVACLLNTSMNVMGEPIVETLEDARRFFENCPVAAIVAEDVLVSRS